LHQELNPDPINAQRLKLLRIHYTPVNLK
jgi:hypothetical protein